MYLLPLFLLFFIFILEKEERYGIRTPLVWLECNFFCCGFAGGAGVSASAVDAPVPCSKERVGSVRPRAAGVAIVKN